MRQVKVNGRYYQLPESWTDVALQRHIDAARALRDNQGHPKKAMCACISALLGFNESTLLSADVDTYDELRKALDFYFTTHPTPRPCTEFELEGTVFHVPTDMQTQTFGEFVDMDTAVLAHKEDLLAAVPEILAIYCRPRGEKYNPEPEHANARIKLMQGLDLETAEGLAAFFLTSDQISSAITVQFGRLLVSLTYKERALRHSMKATAGMRRLLHLPRMIFCAWMRSRIRRLAMS